MEALKDKIKKFLSFGSGDGYGSGYGSGYRSNHITCTEFSNILNAL